MKTGRHERLAPGQPGTAGRALGGFYFLLFTSFGLFAPYIGLFLSRRGWRGQEVGLALFTLTATGFLGQFVFAFLADHAHRKRTIISLLALASGLAGTLLFLARGSLLFGLLALLGLVHRPLVPLTDSAVFDLLDGQREKYSRFRLFGSTGFIFASAVASLLVLPRLGLAGVFPVFGLTLLLAAVLPAWFERPAAASRAPFSLAWLADRRIRGLALLMFLLEFASTAVQGYLGIYMDRFYALPDGAVSLAWAIGVASELVLLVAAPRLLRRYSTRALLGAGGGAAALRYVFLSTTLATGSPRLFFVSQLLHGVYYGIFFAAALGYLDACSPGHLRASIQATVHALSTLAGLLLGYLVNGWVLDAFGLQCLFALSGLFALAGVSLLFTGLLEDAERPLARPRGSSPGVIAPPRPTRRRRPRPCA
ncbi:MAG TPA: MFS transporter [Archangium sp.]|uniref:MFS transporter n=1 Tax=Archangium sp. TaxID=1872627 RepID=UPI002E2EF3B8|nr:MFS transporter [Archangium sp.]HEX5747837.1 MFS transporter [Archangium sp.]